MKLYRLNPTGCSPKILKILKIPNSLTTSDAFISPDISGPMSRELYRVILLLVMRVIKLANKYPLNNESTTEYNVYRQFREFLGSLDILFFVNLLHPFIAVEDAVKISKMKREFDYTDMIPGRGKNEILEQHNHIDEMVLLMLNSQENFWGTFFRSVVTRIHDQIRETERNMILNDNPRLFELDLSQNLILLILGGMGSYLGLVL